MQYARLDEHGYVISVGDFDTPPSDGVPVTGEKIYLSGERIKYVDGKFVKTGKSFFPPAVGMVWNAEKEYWEDGRTEEQVWSAVRTERDRRLQETDWTQLPDVPLETKEAWAVYRQVLRDITEQPDPFNIQWPVPPGA